MGILSHLQHKFNALHLYCRMVDCGLPEPCAWWIARIWGLTCGRLLYLGRF